MPPYSLSDRRVGDTEHDGKLFGLAKMEVERVRTVHATIVFFRVAVALFGMGIGATAAHHFESHLNPLLFELDPLFRTSSITTAQPANRGIPGRGGMAKLLYLYICASNGRCFLLSAQELLDHVGGKEVSSVHAGLDRAIEAFDQNPPL